MALRKPFYLQKKTLDLSSFVNEWVEENRLDEKYDINIRKYENTLTFSLARLRKSKIAKIPIDGISTSLMFKKITGCYFKNYDYINLTGKDCINRIDDVKRLLERFTSIDIIEVSEHKIVLKDMLNPKDLNIRTILHEMIDLERVFFNELTKPDNNSKFFFAQSLDRNINKLTYLGYKALNYNLETLRHPEDVQRTILYWRILAALEDVGDLLKRITRYLKSDKQHNPIIGDLIGEVRDYFFSVVSHIFGKKSAFEDKLDGYLMKKESLLRSFEQFISTMRDDLNLGLVLVQLFKDILGQITTLIYVLIEFE
ncbi:MAG: hypothetical protein ACOCXG_00305 [Nanoarchaeota archaeon]